jgi:hypothetical protein
LLKTVCPGTNARRAAAIEVLGPDVLVGEQFAPVIHALNAWSGFSVEPAAWIAVN